MNAATASEISWKSAGQKGYPSGIQADGPVQGDRNGTPDPGQGFLDNPQAIRIGLFVRRTADL
jgi:hypothetical protein